MDQHDLARVEQVVRNDQAADRILGHHAAGIADDVRFAGLQPEQVFHVEPRVHARHDGQLLGRPYRLPAGVGRFVDRAAARVLVVVGQALFGDRFRHDKVPSSFGVGAQGGCTEPTRAPDGSVGGC